MSSDRNVEILKSEVICLQPGRYIGWPTIDKTPDGELLVAFSGDRDAHVDPFGKTMLVRSVEGGRSWSEPELINDTPLDDRDAGICVCRDGTVVVSWFTSHYQEAIYMKRVYEKRISDVSEEAQKRWIDKIRSITVDDIRQWAGEKVDDGGRYECGCWIRRSTDGARTWEDPVRVPCSAPHGPIELSDGRLMYVGAELSRKQIERKGDIVAVESRDQGKTWSVIGRINMYPEYPGDSPDGYSYLCEPHVVEAEDGQLIGMARYEERPNQKPERTRSVLWQFASEDGGRTWTEPKPTGILGKPPHLTRLQDGRIMVTYGYRHEPYGERACISADGGRNWDYDNEIVLRNDAPSGDLGYPASVQLDDGSIMTVYYQQEHPGEKTCLMTTHWRIR